MVSAHGFSSLSSTLHPSLPQHPPSFSPTLPVALRRRAPSLEVAALRRIGVAAALGIDLAPVPPLVADGDFHDQPFADASFDFEFSNVFDHALYRDRFAVEIQRTLRPCGMGLMLLLHSIAKAPSAPYYKKV